jgi:hypothetical protein
LCRGRYRQALDHSGLDLHPLASGEKRDPVTAGRGWKRMGVVAGFLDLVFRNDSGLVDYRPTRSP